MYLLAPAYTPPSPVIIAEAAEARQGQAVRPPSIDDRPAADPDLPMIPVVPAPSAGQPAAVSAAGGTDRGSPIENIASMVARTAQVDASGFAGAGIDIPPDQRKIEISGQAGVLTTDDPEIARRLDAIKRMQVARAAAGGTQVASLPSPETPVPAVAPASPEPAPARAGMSPAANRALKAIIGQGAPEAGVAAVPAPVGVSQASAASESRTDVESGIDKVKSLFAPKRQTVFGETLVAADGLPAVPPLAAPAKPDPGGDPVVLPVELARIAPALGGAAVAPAPPAKGDPSSAYAESTEPKDARRPAAADSPINNLPSITSMVVPSWQPVADRRSPAPAPSQRPTAAERPRQIVPGRYLIIGSFLRKANAEHLASRQQQVSAAVVPTKINGKTWHRVAVPDRADVRGRVAAAGITDYWILRM